MNSTMVTNSTMVLSAKSTDTLHRSVWVDRGWPECDERLVAVAEVKALSFGRASSAGHAGRAGECADPGDVIGVVGWVQVTFSGMGPSGTPT